MHIKDLKDAEEFIAGDESILRELLHPDKADLDLRYSLAHAIIKPGKTSRAHRIISSEVYYVLEGEGMMHIDDEAKEIKAGQAVYIPPKAKQFLENTGDTDIKFLCIVDPAWKKEDEEVI